VFFDVASHLISEEATTYSAYEFFNSKEAIAVAMQVLPVLRRGAFSVSRHFYVLTFVETSPPRQKKKENTRTHTTI